MRGLYVAGAAIGAAAVAPYVAGAITDALVPIPPLPDASQHNAAWMAAWNYMMASMPFGTVRKRAVTLIQLAQEQADQMHDAGTTITKVDELTWLNGWMFAWRAGFNVDADTFGPVAGQGTTYGGLGGFAGVADDAYLETLLAGGDPGNLSPIGVALLAQSKQYLAVNDQAEKEANGGAYAQTYLTTAHSIGDLARAMDAAEEPTGFWGKLGHDAGWVASGVGSILGAGAAAAGDAIGSLLGGALSGVTAGLVPLAVIAGGGYLAWRHFR